MELLSTVQHSMQMGSSDCIYTTLRAIIPQVYWWSGRLCRINVKSTVSVDLTVTAQPWAGKLTVTVILDLISSTPATSSLDHQQEDCGRSNDTVVQYNVTSLHSFCKYAVEEEPVFSFTMTEEDCIKSCLEDCYCGAVLYMGEDCSKYKLPLRYGRIDSAKSNAAFFKGNRSTQVRGVSIGSKRSLISIISISLGSVSCLCIGLATSSFLVYRYKLDGYRKLSENLNLELAEEFTLRLFSYNELESATDGFKEELGKGSFGAIYKGTISKGGKTIAVKRLEKAVEEGERELRAEITAIARTHHKNLVQVLCFCTEGSRKLLVYEYMKNGSLADLIFKAERRPIWKERIRIALDVARGLLYLHEESEIRISWMIIGRQRFLILGLQNS